MELLVAILICYGMGSLPFAILVARLFGNRNLSRQGSGNIGSTNVARTTGWLAGLITLMLDIGKGAVAMLVAANVVALTPVTEAVTALAVMVGHIRPCLKIKGGKGVAVYFGIIAVLAPPVALVAAAVWLVVAFLSHYASLASLLAAVVVFGLALVNVWYPLAMATLGLSSALLMGALLFWTHRYNIKRLLTNKELPIRLSNGS